MTRPPAPAPTLPGYTLIRPLGGGREWDVEPEDVREATSSERLSAATAHVNARSRGEVP